MHHKGIPLLVLLEYFICVQGVPDLRTLPVSRCDGHSCNPSVGNLATGRTVSTLSSCGQNGTELYCSYPDPGLSACQRPKCGKCNAQHPGHAHRAAHMTDDFFSNPGTWWQSAAGVNREELRLDLETEFYLTHVIVRFRSPRPAAMTLERSQDYGRSWRPYKHFAVNCSETFGIPDDASHAGSLCTSRYSHALPCTKGEVIFRALTPGSGIEDPYNAEAQDLLKLTTLRLRLLKRQDCPCRGAPAGALPKPQHSAHYAVYDLIAHGSCFCNGHAEDCQPAPGTRREGSMVHGSCLCQHHTAGEHCETCAPLYNDLPWRPGDGKTGAPNECKKCQCHGHAESCHFDSGVWLASGKRSGGVCDGCRHNTKGRRCQRCQAGFYRDQAKPMSSPDACKRDNTVVIFRALTPGSGIEDPYNAEAQDLLKLTTLRLRLLKRQDCPCRGAPAGALPKPQHSAHYAVYDLIAHGSCFCNGHAEDCQPAPGTRREGSMVHGSCLCQHHTAGEHCETCAPLYNDLPWRPGDGKTGAPNECKKCQCHGHAESCHFDSGVWLASGKRSGGVCDGCRHNTKGRRCQRCQAGFYRDQAKPMSSPDACKPCSCHTVGSTNGSYSRLWKCHPRSGYCYCKPGVAGPNCARCMMGYWGFGESGCWPCDCARDCDPETGECLDSFDHEPFFDVPIGGRIPDLIHVPTNESEGEWTWEDEQGFSALRHPEKCICKEKMLGGVPDFCKMKYAYVIKARILSAHDKGTHAEAVVKVKKVMRQGKVKISPGNRSIYPESWTNRGCTCPVMNPGTDYLIAGHEDFRTSKLLVNMHSLVKPWKASVGKQVTEILQSGCK